MVTCLTNWERKVIVAARMRSFRRCFVLENCQQWRISTLKIEKPSGLFAGTDDQETNLIRYSFVL